MPKFIDKGGIMSEKKIILNRPNKEIYVECDMLVKKFDKTFKKSDILNEAINQTRVAEAGLNVPEIYDVRLSEDSYSIVMQYIEGKSLEELMKEHPEKSDEYLTKFVEVQRDMHKYNVPLLNRTKEKFTRKLYEADIDGNIKYELLMRLEGMPTHFKLCHGDFDPSNIIMGDDGKTYIIDWSHVTTGNGSADAARTYLIFKLQGKDDLAEKYLKMFCTKTDTAIQYVQRILPIVAASQSVKGKPEEQEFLAKWVNVCDWQ